MSEVNAGQPRWITRDPDLCLRIGLINVLHDSHFLQKQSPTTFRLDDQAPTTPARVGQNQNE